MSSTTHKLPATKCPACGRTNNRSSAVEGVDPTPPEPGDVSICIGCGSIGIYTADLGMRAPTMVEVSELMRMPQVVRAVRAWHQAFDGMPSRL